MEKIGTVPVQHPLLKTSAATITQPIALNAEHGFITGTSITGLMTMKELVVKEQIEITASKGKVWEVLTNPVYIKQWDDIPENYSGERLQLNSVLEWEGYSKLTVTALVNCQFLKLSMYLPKAGVDPTQYDVSYQYTLTENNGKTKLTIEIGDFSPLPTAIGYYEASLEWAETAKQKIKALSEQ